MTKKVFDYAFGAMVAAYKAAHKFEYIAITQKEPGQLVKVVKATSAIEIKAQTGLTKKALIAEIETLCNKVFWRDQRAKKQIEAENKHISPLKRLEAEKNQAASSILSYLVTSDRNDFRVSREADCNDWPIISVDKRTTQDGYYGGFPRYNYHYIIDIPTNLRNDCFCSQKDEAGEYFYSEPLSHGVSKRYYIVRTKGNNYEVRRIFLIEETINGITYNFHASQIKDLIPGLRKKMKLEKRKAEVKVPRIITPKIYARLTGACIPGIEAFIEKHKIPGGKIKRNELLAILTPSDYGYHKFITLMEQKQKGGK